MTSDCNLKLAREVDLGRVDQFVLTAGRTCYAAQSQQFVCWANC